MGWPVVMIAKVLGHENTQTSMGYIGWHNAQAADAIAEMFPELPRRRDRHGAAPPAAA